MTRASFRTHVRVHDIRHFPSWHPFPHDAARAVQHNNCERKKEEWRTKGENLTEPLSDLRERGMTIRDSFPSLVRRKGGQKKSLNAECKSIPMAWLAPLLNYKFGSWQRVLWIRSSVQQASPPHLICCALYRGKRESNYQVSIVLSQD